MSPLRIGVFGGAFDPPHRAHVALVRCAIETLGLQRVHVLPTGQPWHRPQALQASAAQRLEMVRLAFADLPQVLIDARELQRSGPSYTVDTLHELRLHYAAQSEPSEPSDETEQPLQLYLLIGEDQRQALPRWHRIDEIARLAIICAASRTPQTASPSAAAPPPPTPPVLPLPMPLMALSATDIRARLAQGRSIRDCVSPTVERYIHTHHLYSPR